MSVYGMTSVTVGVSSIDESLGLFHDVMNLQVDSDAEATRALLDAWGLPAPAAGPVHPGRNRGRAP